MSKQARFLKPNNSFALERSLHISKNQQVFRKSVFWGTLNALVFSILLFDISNTCPLYLNYYNYAEYALCFITGLNLLYFSAKILVLSFNKNQIPITIEQKRLLGICDDDPNFKIVNTLNASAIHETIHQNMVKSFMKESLSKTPTTPLSTTPLNMTALSWRSSNMTNDSLNYSLSSPSWSFHKASSFDLNNSSSPFSFPPPPNSQSPHNPTNSSFQYRDTSGIDFISDENDLDKYLQEFEANTSIKNLNNQNQQPTNLLSSFWSHPVTKTAKDMSSFLKKCSYQLSSQPPLTSSPKGNTENNKTSPTVSQTLAMVAWNHLNVDIVSLTQWNENLRKWISQTILERLVKEFENVNESLEKQGLTDIKIGSVGLDRLRKTAQLTHITHFIPSLSTLIPFLECTSNQEYLARRIRELAKGGCMSEFKWNGGSSYNAKDWDESLPTDAAIVMNLLASYLDTQLMPLPSMPDTKPFSGLYYIKTKDKLPTLTPNSLFIQQVSEKPPHYRVIVGETVYEMVKGYSNLFHTILFFLYHVSKKEHGMLGRVNLGRAGVNMLWIIEQ